MTYTSLPEQLTAFQFANDPNPKGIFAPHSALSAFQSFEDQTYVKHSPGVECMSAAGNESMASETGQPFVNLGHCRMESIVEADALPDLTNQPSKSAILEPASRDAANLKYPVAGFSEETSEKSDHSNHKCVFPNSSDSNMSSRVDSVAESECTLSDLLAPSVSLDVEIPSLDVVLRSYQLELAAPGVEGQNCIICAPTGSGKTFTAGYICRQQRRAALERGHKFKAVFIVCIRNLILQQRDALRQVIADANTVTGIDDRLTLSEFLNHYDVVVATAQVRGSTYF